MNRLLATPISNFDIERKLQGRTRIIFYEDLYKIKNILSYLDKGSLIILFKSKPDFGHWTSLVLTPEGIEFFDSYGDKPEGAKRGVNKEFLKRSNQYRNRLAQLLYNASSQIPINYNNHRLQKSNKDVATCGKHVITRILRRDLTNNEYNKWLRNLSKKNQMTTDEVVCQIYEEL